jgi:ribA/ribD-fused uncharacterized protein
MLGRDGKMIYEFFYKTASPFSQWHPAKFLGDVYQYGDEELAAYFENAEQYMMWRKAWLFKDEEVAYKVIDTPDPRTVKALGKDVQNFDQRLWDACKFDIVVLGNLYKFSQNKHLGQKLLDTGKKILVEASPSDKIWGIGLDEETARKTPEDDWPGENLLGKALMRVRYIMRSTIDVSPVF